MSHHNLLINSFFFYPNYSIGNLYLFKLIYNLINCKISGNYLLLSINLIISIINVIYLLLLVLLILLNYQISILH